MTALEQKAIKELQGAMVGVNIAKSNLMSKVRNGDTINSEYEFEQLDKATKEVWEWICALMP